jgi:23S rRNA G2445 N2-methylase RlmL
MIKSLEQVREEMTMKKEYEKGLKELSKVQINIVKDKAEVLLGTSNEELHKHGYKPFIRWGVLKETLTAACILESGIIRKANKTGKLYLWDPFCGSGSFVIETLMMLLDQPVRHFEGQGNLPFEHWPIHKREEYLTFKEDLNDFQKLRK